eukprot:15365245-Ditylum_brightwellii.AAC.1
MSLESVDVIFIASGRIAYKPRLLTDECYKHTFGGWRSSKYEFNIVQAILMEEKRWVQTKAILEANLKTMQLKYELKGYKRTFHYGTALGGSKGTWTWAVTILQRVQKKSLGRRIEKLFLQKQISVPSVAEKDDVAESNEGDSPTEEASLGVDSNENGKDNAISSSDELRPEKIATMLAKIQQTTVSSDDFTDEQPDWHMTSTTIVDSGREDGSKDGGKMPSIERFFN